jgi:hypothetical protein
VVLLVGSVLHLARALTPPVGVGDWHLEPVRVAIGDLAAALALAEADRDAATTHVTAASNYASALSAAARSGTESLLANAIQTCVDDLQKVIDLRQPIPVRSADSNRPEGGVTPAKDS